MKILISAIACHPTKGSEDGVGWGAVGRIASEHQVFLITHRRNEKDWLQAERAGEIPSNIKVRFMGVDRPWNNNRFIARMESWIDFWQFNSEILSIAESWHKEENFDICHQLTIATWRVASPLWRLPIPFVWGPIGGSGTIPKSFRSTLSISARMFELTRDIHSFCIIRTKAFRDCVNRSAAVIAANTETYDFLSKYRKSKNGIYILPVASLGHDKIRQFCRPESNNEHHSELLRIFAGGNIGGSKGVKLALLALRKVKDEGIKFKYIIAGGGPEISYLRDLACKLNIINEVEFHPGFRGRDYVEVLQNTDVYLLPSYRETLGMTLQEAILAGCYPIVANMSAQGEIVTMSGGAAVTASTPEEMVVGLADALIQAAKCRREIHEIGVEAAKKVAEYFSDDRYIKVVNEAYSNSLINKERNTNYVRLPALFRCIRRCWLYHRGCIGNSPRRVELLGEFVPKWHNLVVTYKCNLCVEGYPRCANTYTVALLKHSRSDELRHSSHTHCVGNVLRARELGVPVVLLIREPEDCIASHAIFEPEISLHRHIVDYINFYQRLLPYRDEFIVVNFKGIITDHNGVIRRLREITGEDYREVDLSDDVVRCSIDKLVEEWHFERARVNQEDIEDSIARPSEVRNRTKRNIIKNLNDNYYLARLLDEARSIYLKYSDEL